MVKEIFSYQRLLEYFKLDYINELDLHFYND